MFVQLSAFKKTTKKRSISHYHSSPVRAGSLIMERWGGGWWYVRGVIWCCDGRCVQKLCEKYH